MDALTDWDGAGGALPDGVSRLYCNGCCTALGCVDTETGSTVRTVGVNVGVYVVCVCNAGIAYCGNPTVVGGGLGGA